MFGASLNGCRDRHLRLPVHSHSQACSFHPPSVSLLTWWNERQHSDLPSLGIKCGSFMPVMVIDYRFIGTDFCTLLEEGSDHVIREKFSWEEVDGKRNFPIRESNRRLLSDEPPLPPPFYSGMNIRMS